MCKTHCLVWNHRGTFSFYSPSTNVSVTAFPIEFTPLTLPYIFSSAAVRGGNVSSAFSSPPIRTWVSAISRRWRWKDGDLPCTQGIYTFGRLSVNILALIWDRLRSFHIRKNQVTEFVVTIRNGSKNNRCWFSGRASQTGFLTVTWYKLIILIYLRVNLG